MTNNLSDTSIQFSLSQLEQLKREVDVLLRNVVNQEESPSADQEPASLVTLVSRILQNAELKISKKAA